SWARQVGLLFGFTVQAASIVLVSFFCGLGVGYAATARYASRARRPLKSYGVCECLAGLWALAVPQLIAHAGTLLPADIVSSQSIAAVLMRAIFCFLILLPATFALGATLPYM